MAGNRDWSELPMDLICVITMKLPDLADFIRFRAVCKSWRSTPLSACPSQLPWLLEWPKRTQFEPILKREHRFYSPSSGENGIIHVEESYGYKFMAPCKNYLPLLRHPDLDSSELSLLNPLTKKEISLPLPALLRWPAWIGADATCNEDLVVLDQDIYDSPVKGKCFYHHPNNKDWISVDVCYRSNCYWNGMFFNTDICCDTEVFNVTSQKLLHKIPPPKCEITSGLSSELLPSAYLVESSNEILRVTWYNEWYRNSVQGSVFHIHQLDFHGGRGHPCWVKVNSIGDQMIFLDQWSGFSISAKPSASAIFQGNSIFFLHFWRKTPYRYDIEAGTIEKMPCPFINCIWFVPSLQ